MRNRRIHIAIAFVWALAHGVWMGAGMHSFTAVGARMSSSNKGGVPSCVACRAVSDVTSAETVCVRADGCAVCELSTLLPEASNIAIPTVFASPATFEDPIPFAEAVLISDPCSLPPAHAPPV